MNTLKRKTSRYRHILSSLFTFCMALLIGSQPVSALDFVAAGAPKQLVMHRDYSTLFNALKADGIKSFAPTFQYLEVPSPKSFGFEQDFMAPCDPAAPAFKALRKTGVKLLIPGELLYPNPAYIGASTVDRDPLAMLLKCAGRKQILGVTNYDEAVFHGVSRATVKKLYDRVKQIDPTLPVYMVHAPIVMDKSEFRSEHLINAYLEKVIAYSEYGDVVGFDVYPEPAIVAQLATPLSEGQIREPQVAVGEYAKWLEKALPQHRRLMALQGFAFSDLYEDSFLNANVPQELLALVHAPSRDLLDQMIQQVRDSGADTIIWWGQAALENTEQEPWPSIVELSQKYGR